jgi:hypothetical protein
MPGIIRQHLGHGRSISARSSEAKNVRITMDYASSDFVTSVPAFHTFWILFKFRRRLFPIEIGMKWDHHPQCLGKDCIHKERRLSIMSTWWIWTWTIWRYTQDIPEIFPWNPISGDIKPGHSIGTSGSPSWTSTVCPKRNGDGRKMARYGKIWQDGTPWWYDMIFYDIKWNYMKLYTILWYITWYHVILCDIVW